MVKSKTKIEEQARRKTNFELVETITHAKKHKAWLRVADKLAGPRRTRVAINLNQIDRESKDGETIVIPGKVLGEGNVNKKLRIVAWNFSESAIKKLKEKKCEAIMISEEIKKNPEGKRIRIIE